METGSLVIDKGEKNKPLKRKVLTATSNTPQDTPEVKKKRGRGKAANDTSKHDAALDSQGEESPKEVVSRSGSKIKSKRFADISSVLEKLGTGSWVLVAAMLDRESEARNGTQESSVYHFSPQTSRSSMAAASRSTVKRLASIPHFLVDEET